MEVRSYLNRKEIVDAQIHWNCCFSVLSTPLLIVIRAIYFCLYGLINTSGLAPIACKNCNPGRWHGYRVVLEGVKRS
jgi:hypothetical protein